MFKTQRTNQTNTKLPSIYSPIDPCKILQQNAYLVLVLAASFEMCHVMTDKRSIFLKKLFLEKDEINFLDSVVSIQS